MEFIVIMIVAVVTANSISDGSSTIQESKELKNIEELGAKSQKNLMQKAIIKYFE